MTTLKKITTVRADGKTEVGRAGVVTDDDVQRSMEETHNRLSRQAQYNGNILSVEEAGNSLVVMYKYGAVEVHQWIKGEQ